MRWIGIVMAVVCGCAGLLYAADAASQPGTGASDPIARWSAGEKDSAVDQFVAADWTKGDDLFPAESVFRMTESQFTSKSADERKRLAQVIQSQTDQWRDLVREVLNRGSHAKADGKRDEAKKFW